MAAMRSHRVSLGYPIDRNRYRLAMLRLHSLAKWMERFRIYVPEESAIHDFFRYQTPGI